MIRFGDNTRNTGAAQQAPNIASRAARILSSLEWLWMYSCKQTSNMEEHWCRFEDLGYGGARAGQWH